MAAHLLEPVHKAEDQLREGLRYIRLRLRNGSRSLSTGIRQQERVLGRNRNPGQRRGQNGQFYRKSGCAIRIY